MPYYDFECLKCKETFTVRMTFAEHDQHKEVKCPKCGRKKVERVITPVLGKTSKKS